MKSISDLRANLLKIKSSFTKSFKDEFSKDLISDVDSLLNDLDELEKIDTLKVQIENRIFNPIKKLVREKKVLQYLSLGIGFTSLFLSLYSMFDARYIQPNIIKESIKGISVNPKADSIGRFVTEEDKQGLFKNGMVIIPPIYDRIEILPTSEKGEFYKVTNNDKSGLVSEKGEVVILTKYLELNSWNGTDIILTNDKNQKSIVNVRGKTIMPFLFHQLKGYDENYFFFCENKRWGIFDVKTNTVKAPAIFEDVVGLSSKNNFYYGKLNGRFNFYEIPDIFKKETEFVEYVNITDQIIDKNGFSISIFVMKNKSGKYGLADTRGWVIESPVYDTIFYNSKNQIILSENGETETYNLVR